MRQALNTAPPKKTLVVESRPETVSSCHLDQFTLQCPDGIYQLVTDKSNQQLAPDALSDAHKLMLPLFVANPSDPAALDKYLADAYGRYLQAMMDIGLGSQTMTYAVFANLYDFNRKEHLDFPGRFAAMYDMLKQEKATIAVSTKPHLPEGFNLQYCSQLDNLVACDYQKNNYLFAKPANTQP